MSQLPSSNLNSASLSWIMSVIIYLKPIFKKAIYNALALFKFMVPTVIAIKIFQELNLVGYLAYPFTPIMEVLGLPSIYALAWIGGILNNNYTTFSILLLLFPSAPLNYEQLTVITLISLVFHSIIVESTIAYKLKINPFWSAGIRFISAVILGFLVHIICQYFGLMQDLVKNPLLYKNYVVNPNFMDLIHNATLGSNYSKWLLRLAIWIKAEVMMLLLITIIIFLAFLLVQLLKDLRLLNKINLLFSPLCRILKISKYNSMVTLITYIIGLSYGWGLLKEEATVNKFFKKDQAFKVITFLSLAHAIIEDSIIFIILGANGWILILGRTLWAFVVVYVVSRALLPNLTEKFKNKYLYH
ncbi:hypothetical protein ABSA28_00670 [Candidatus Hepatincolaceae symbiont of Richtersius coronifer]